MTAATGLKRLGIILLAVVAGGLLVLTTAGYLISADTVRQQVLGEIRGVTGLEPVLRGKASVSLFPTGSVSFDDVILGDAKQPALVAERLTARLRFFPLLIGRVEIADVTLDRPNISVELNPNGQSNWSGLIEALTRSQSAAQRLSAFSEMRIEGGTIAIRDKARKITETLSGVEQKQTGISLLVDQRRVMDNEHPAGVIVVREDIRRVGTGAMHLAARGGCDVFKACHPGRVTMHLDSHVGDVHAHVGCASENAFPRRTDGLPPRKTLAPRMNATGIRVHRPHILHQFHIETFQSEVEVEVGFDNLLGSLFGFRHKENPF